MHDKEKERRRINGWRAANRDKTRGYALKERYNLTVQEYDQLLADQGGRCGVCRRESPGKKRWHVDHNHSCCPGEKSCGKCVRGLLCSACNRALGLLRDDILVFQAAIKYLERQSSRQGNH